jgi:predicted Fe-Mo cluster-binding NifX family protein
MHKYIHIEKPLGGFVKDYLYPVDVEDDEVFVKRTQKDEAHQAELERIESAQSAMRIDAVLARRRCEKALAEIFDLCMTIKGGEGRNALYQVLGKVQGIAEFHGIWLVKP